MPATGIIRITDRLMHIPKVFAFQEKTTEYYLKKAIGDKISIIKDPQKTLPFLSYNDATKFLTNYIDHILQRSTAQPRLKFLPLSTMLPQSQDKTILPQKLPSHHVARFYIFSFIWRCYDPKRDILDYWGTNILCILS